MDVTYIKNIQKTGSTHVQHRKMKQSQAHKIRTRKFND